MNTFTESEIEIFSLDELNELGFFLHPGSIQIAFFMSNMPIDTLGGPFGTVPELLFEKKPLIPALQQLLIANLG